MIFFPANSEADFYIITFKKFKIFRKLLTISMKTIINCCTIFSWGRLHRCIMDPHKTFWTLLPFRWKFFFLKPISNNSTLFSQPEIKKKNIKYTFRLASLKSVQGIYRVCHHTWKKNFKNNRWYENCLKKKYTYYFQVTNLVVVKRKLEKNLLLKKDVKYSSFLGRVMVMDVDYD